mmetsp:Transcript_60729/g.159703  ORF Transcript_60729/g.159703 Transcript_60729/m.159703 type:complete len:231 (-) Transcript_60729:1428-2120(-)
MFTASPRHPNFILVSLPRFPESTSPVCTPMRISSGGRGGRMPPSFLFSSGRADCCAIAAMQAFVAWSLTMSGVFQKARMPSPRYSLTTPSKCSTMAVIIVRYLVSSTSKSVGESASVIVVKPRMSETNMVTSRRKTWGIIHFSLPRTMFLTTPAGTKRENVLTLTESRQRDSCNSATFLILERLLLRSTQSVEKSSLDIWRIWPESLLNSREMHMLRLAPMRVPMTSING